MSTSSLSSPEAVTVDGNGNVYIADTSHNRVLKEDLSDPPSLSFAATVAGSTSSDSPRTITVENIGNAPLTLTVPGTGHNPAISANFILNTSGGSACPLVTDGASAGALAAGASCLLPVSFMPATEGSLSGTLTLTDNNLNAASPTYATQTISLSGTGTGPVLTSPTPGAVLGTTNVVFSWTPCAGVTEYDLYLGTTGAGSVNLYNSAGVRTTFVTVPTLPSTGATVYARLYSQISGVWQYSDYTHTESPSVPPVLTSPTPGSVLGTTNVVFSWTPGAGITEYDLYLGTTGVGSDNLYNSTGVTTTSVTVPTLPSTGATIYARLNYQINGVWQSIDYTYTEQ
jgi:hypothetical protein